MLWILPAALAENRNNPKIEKFYYKALKIINNKNESFEELVRRSSKVSVHQKHLHYAN